MLQNERLFALRIRAKSDLVVGVGNCVCSVSQSEMECIQVNPQHNDGSQEILLMLYGKTVKEQIFALHWKEGKMIKLEFIICDVDFVSWKENLSNKLENIDFPLIVRLLMENSYRTHLASRKINLRSMLALNINIFWWSFISVIADGGSEWPTATSPRFCMKVGPLPSPL